MSLRQVARIEHFLWMDNCLSRIMMILALDFTESAFDFKVLRGQLLFGDNNVQPACKIYEPLIHLLELHVSKTP